MLHRLAFTTKRSISCNIAPCSVLKVNRRFLGTHRLRVEGRRISQAGNEREVCSAFYTCLKLLSCLSYFSIRKMETGSSETSVNFQRTRWRYITKDRILCNHRYENLKSHTHSLEFFISIPRVVIFFSHKELRYFHKQTMTTFVVLDPVSHYLACRYFRTICSVI